MTTPAAVRCDDTRTRKTVPDRRRSAVTPTGASVPDSRLRHILRMPTPDRRRGHMFSAVLVVAVLVPPTVVPSACTPQRKISDPEPLSLTRQPAMSDVAHELIRYKLLLELPP